MSEPARSPGLDGVVESHPLRGRSFAEILDALAKLEGIRGGLLVAPDGLVIASTLSTRFAVEALAAVGAALGRELERGTERFGRGELRTAVFAAADGMIVMGTSLVGFLILLGERSTDVAAARTALRHALSRLQAHSP